MMFSRVISRGLYGSYDYSHYSEEVPGGHLNHRGEGSKLGDFSKRLSKGHKDVKKVDRLKGRICPE